MRRILHKLMVRLAARRPLRLMSAALLSFTGSFALAQPAPTGQPKLPTVPDTNVEAAPSTMPPVVPDTNVEAAPNPNVDPNAFDPNVFNENPGFDPVIDGFRFGSPANSGYRADSSTTGTIIDIPDRDNPGTVNTITESLLRDQQALKFGDVVRNAGGVSIGGDGLFVDRIFLRGFEVQSRDFRRDGFLDPTYSPRDFQSVERVEILKGPASVLYGVGSPAGTVNLISKKPVDDTFADLAFQFGAFNQARYTMDVNGRATEEGNVLYRVNVAHEDSQSFKDFGFLSRTLVAPGVTWNINESTRISWYGEWHRDHRIGDQGVPVVGGDPLALPPNRYVGEPANDFLHFEEFRQTLMLTHELSDDWTLQVGGRSLFYSFPGSVTAASGNPAPGFFPDAPEPFFYRSRTDITKEDEQAQSFIANLAGEFYTGALLHKTVVGLEYVYFDSDAFYAFGALSPLDVTNPTYTDPATIPLGATGFPSFRQQRVGAYLQDLVELTPQWKALGAVRFDTVDLHFDRVLFFGGPPAQFVTDQNFDRVSPRGGLVFQPYGDDVLAFYFNYSQSFSPPGGGIYTNPGGLKPILGEGYEIGVKTEVIDNVSLNVAGFYATRQNADLNTSSFFLIQVGEERSQGAEVNLVGQITDRWSAIANYTYTDVRLFDPLDPTLDGNRQRNVPYNSANFWTRYNLIDDEVRTFGAALGLVYLDRRPGDLQNTFELPSYGRWDAGLFYTQGSVFANLYAENLFDTQYAASSVNEFQVFQGAPFNVRVQLGWSY